MVRIYVSGGGSEIPMDFDPEEADEIAEEMFEVLNDEAEESVDENTA